VVYDSWMNSMPFDPYAVSGARFAGHRDSPYNGIQRLLFVVLGGMPLWRPRRSLKERQLDGVGGKG
jgi:hypothetical protein